MEEIKAYKTTDGKIFELEEEAKERQKEIDFIELYEENKLYMDNGEGCDVEDVLWWIRSNKEMVLKILDLKKHEIEELEEEIIELHI